MRTAVLTTTERKNSKKDCFFFCTEYATAQPKVSEFAVLLQLNYSISDGNGDGDIDSTTRLFMEG